MKFIHAADIHLDSPLAGLMRRDDVPGHVTHDATRRAFTNLIDLAITENVAFVLIAGDLYDSNWRDFNTGLFFAREMRRLDRPCILIRGNHDASAVLTRHLHPPPNVTVLSARKVETCVLEAHGVAIHGQSFPSRAVTEDLSAAYPPPRAGLFNIGLLHTSAEDPGEHETYAPCRVESLAVKGYDYWALGHIHARRTLHERPWIVFPGNIQGRHVRESGAKGCALVEVRHGRVESVEHRATDVLRWAQIAVDLDGAATAEEIALRLRFALSEAQDAAEGRPLHRARHAHRCHAAARGDARRSRRDRGRMPQRRRFRRPGRVRGAGTHADAPAGRRRARRRRSACGGVSRRPRRSRPVARPAGGVAKPREPGAAPARPRAARPAADGGGTARAGAGGVAGGGASAGRRWGGMKLTRLVLARYGHLADVTLNFPAERGLHVVLGANEAGKSTALAAIGDALFGFPHRTEFAFRHEARELRVGVGLRADDGRQEHVLPPQGPQGRPVRRGRPAAAGERDRRLSRRRHARAVLQRVRPGRRGIAARRGGDPGRQGRGRREHPAGAYRAAPASARSPSGSATEAGRLAGDRRGRRALHAALDAFKAARADLDQRSVEPDAYRHAEDEHDPASRGPGGSAHEAAALHAERARLARIRATAPARAAIARAEAARAALGAVPALPTDAEAQRQDAVAQRERAAHDLARERERAAALEAALAALVVDDALLVEADAMDALAAERNRIAAAARDREKRGIEAAQQRAAVAQAARRLGLDDDAAAVAARIPDALQRDAANRMISAHERLAARQAKAREDAETARAEAAEAAERLARLPAAAPAEALRAAIEPAKAEGRLDADRAQAAQAVAAAREALQAALAALPLWTGTAEALADLPVPLDAALAAGAKELAEAEALLGNATTAVAAHDRALAEIAADLRAIREAATLASPEAIAAARARRDQAWALIRRQHVGGRAAALGRGARGTGRRRTASGRVRDAAAGRGCAGRPAGGGRDRGGAPRGPARPAGAGGRAARDGAGGGGRGADRRRGRRRAMGGALGAERARPARPGRDARVAGTSRRRAGETRRGAGRRTRPGRGGGAPRGRLGGAGRPAAR